jgi:hypothetical protein
LLGFLASLRQQIGEKGEAGLTKIIGNFALSRFIAMV